MRQSPRYPRPTSCLQLGYLSSLDILLRVTASSRSVPARQTPFGDGRILSGGDVRVADSPNPDIVRICAGFADCGGCDCWEWPPQDSYGPSYMDSQSCVCLGESSRLRQTRSYFLVLTAVGHCIDSVEESTVHQTGFDYCLIAWGGLTAIGGLWQNHSVLACFLCLLRVARRLKLLIRNLRLAIELG